MARTNRNHHSYEPSRGEEWVSRDELCLVTEQDGGLVSVSMVGPAGTTYTIRCTDGTMSTIFLHEVNERYYANVVLMAVGPYMVFETEEALGPFLTQKIATDAAGEWAGRRSRELQKEIEGPDDEDDEA